MAEMQGIEEMRMNAVQTSMMEFSEIVDNVCQCYEKQAISFRKSNETIDYEAAFKRFIKKTYN
jgi:hypothetical protein